MFTVDDEWVSALPFDRLPKGIKHLPLECVVYVPSTQGDRVIDEAEFAARRDETADLLSSLFGGCREALATGRYWRSGSLRSAACVADRDDT